jgi:hypothetical protein
MFVLTTLTPSAKPGNTKGGSITVRLISCLTGLESSDSDNICFYLQNRLIPTSQAGGQWYSDTSPFSIPWRNCQFLRREGDEELEEVELGVLREGDDDPERRVEVVDIDEEGGVLLQPEHEVVLGKPVLEHGAVLESTS